MLEVFPRNVRNENISSTVQYNTTAHFIKGSEFDAAKFMIESKNSNPLILLPLNEYESNEYREIFRRTDINYNMEEYPDDKILYLHNVELFRGAACCGYDFFEHPTRLSVSCAKTIKSQSQSKIKSQSQSKIKSQIRKLLVDFFKIANIKGHDSLVISGWCILSNNWNSEETAKIVREIASNCNLKYIAFTYVDEKQCTELQKGIKWHQNKKCCIM